MPIAVRTDRLPIVVVELGATFDEHEYSAAFERYIELSASVPYMAYLVDMRRADPLRMPASKRGHIADVFKANVGRVHNVTVCEARLVSSEITRGIVTAFDWLTGTKWPCATFTSPADADRWIARRMPAFAEQQGAAFRIAGSVSPQV